MSDPGRQVPLPKNARLVLDLLAALPAGEHLDAQAVHAVARGRHPGIGVSTVYRALERLTQAGLVHSMRVPGTTSLLYEVARTGHAHFLCTGCGAIADLDYDLPDADLARLGASHGLTITGTALTFSGLCARCAAAR